MFFFEIVKKGHNNQILENRLTRIFQYLKGVIPNNRIIQNPLSQVEV
jgi:hypothetical protein